MSKKSASHSPKSKSPKPSSPSPTPKSSPIDEAQLRCAFAMLDVNKDGRVNGEELKCMMESLGIDVCDQIIKNLLKDASKNGDGLISESEFLSWMTKMTTPADEDDLERDLRAAFIVFDRDQNGYITRDELKSAMQLMEENVTDKELDLLLMVTDKDKDGRINYEDFIKMLL